MNVEFRLYRQAISIEGLEVLAERTATQPTLLRVGFYDRSRRGLGRFITPETIENSTALSTADLFFGIAGLTVQRNGVTGDQVVMQGTRGPCLPTLYVDGLQVRGAPIGSIAPLQTVDAVEVYRRAVEVPVQYGSRGIGTCGVILPSRSRNFIVRRVPSGRVATTSSPSKTTTSVGGWGIRLPPSRPKAA